LAIRHGPPDESETFDVCVVGAGPAGLAAALACGARGCSVVLLEAGGAGPSASVLPSAQILTADVHAPLNMTTRAGLGGTSSVWGGLCVPFDLSAEDDPAPQTQKVPCARETDASSHRLTNANSLCGKSSFSRRNLEALHLRSLLVRPIGTDAADRGCYAVIGVQRGQAAGSHRRTESKHLSQSLNSNNRFSPSRTTSTVEHWQGRPTFICACRRR
jgi:hypothetical protein